MGKLNSSLILRSIVSFNSSLSCSVNTIATHIEGLSKIPMSAKGSPKKHDRFDNVDDALDLFNKMIGKYPKPSIVEFNKLLAAMVRMKHYSLVVSMYTQLELFGVSDLCTTTLYVDLLLRCDKSILI
ncbi:hypothetical protein HRI_004998700 [Hibiscus trionum]|uniref:Pentatricopeptide repeat-containing protein n=1 Tax=Hibiscus trionum TaxID=183268 RepID=A0A9W7JEY5_HIBTR|nr:hypothetical protein HRI_004998700 [Hibiscus trionum]